MISSSAPEPVRPSETLDDDLMISAEPDPISVLFGPELMLPVEPRPAPPVQPYVPELPAPPPPELAPGAPELPEPPTYDPGAELPGAQLPPAAAAEAVSMEKRRTAMFMVVLPLLAGGAGATVARTFTTRGTIIAGAAALAAGATVGAALLVKE
jgi:hypothetical protein